MTAIVCITFGTLVGTAAGFVLGYELRIADTAALWRIGRSK